MIRPYLRDLINDHKLTMELNNDNNDNNNDNNNNNNNNNRAEWKIQLSIQNSCIFTKRFEETRTINAKSETLEILWVVTQKMSLINFLIHFYKDFNVHVHKKHQMREEANLFLIVLNYYIIFKE